LSTQRWKDHFQFSKDIIKAKIADFKKELRALKKDCGGIRNSFFPLCGEDDKEDYEDINESLTKSKKDLEKFEEDAKEFNNKQLELKKKEEEK
jgi:hypothetical protein